MRIGVISDTHNLLRPEVIAALEPCAAIIHAGDFCSQEILEALRAVAPLYAVRGNNDWALKEAIPRRLDFIIEGIPFTMIHNHAELPEELGEARVVIFGHSHKYFERHADGRLWLNPGSCGRRRFGLELTYAIMTIDQGRVTVKKISLDEI